MDTHQPSLEQTELEALLDTVRAESNRRKSMKYVLWLLVALMAVWLVAMIYSVFVLKLKGIGGLNPGMFVGVIVGMTAISNKQKEATKALAKYDDVRAIGAFADVLDNPDKKLAMIAEEKLIKLLPLVKATDASLLNDEQRRKLNSALEKRSSTLACAIMKAYEQIGSSDAIPFVERVIKNTDQVLRKQAAERCLPFLQQRAATEKERQTLLRASDANTLTTAPNILLRPAAPTEGVYQSETLLRPVQNEEDALMTLSETDRAIDTRQYTGDSPDTANQSETILHSTQH